MAAFGVASLGGAVFGGWLADRVARWRARMVPVASGAVGLLAAVPLLVLLDWPPRRGVAHLALGVPVALSAVAGFLMLMPAPCNPLMRLNVNPIQRLLPIRYWRLIGHLEARTVGQSGLAARPTADRLTPEPR